MSDSRIQRLCAWSGMLGAGLFFSALIISNWFPPPSPSMDMEQVVAMYRQNTNHIRVGMVLFLFSSMFISPFVALISVHLRRMERGMPLMTYTQLSMGTTTVLFSILPAICFLITAFRPQRPPEITYMWNDVSWIMAFIGGPAFIMQNISIAVAILRDTSPQPIFPRWLAFFQIWTALGLVPGCMLVFYTSGPFAWNGLFAWWLPAVVFGAWYIVMLLQLLKVIRRQEQETLA